jgi:predicted DCC family thiol-disulfide oxidoreductase YuxK
MTAMLLFDGDCAFCSTSARFLQRWVRPDCLVLPYQLVDLPRWGITRQEAAEEVLLARRADATVVDRRADATVVVSGGSAAITEALRLGRQPWPLIGSVLQAPGVRIAADLVYWAVAANRHRLPGGTPACAIDGVSPAVPIG